MVGREYISWKDLYNVEVQPKRKKNLAKRTNIRSEWSTKTYNPVKLYYRMYIAAYW